MTPTVEQRRRAAETLAAIARIDSLQGGIVEFDAGDLAGGWWYEAEELRGSLRMVWAPVPVVDDALEARSLRYIEQGVEYRERCLVENARASAEYEVRPPSGPIDLDARDDDEDDVG